MVRFSLHFKLEKSFFVRYTHGMKLSATQTRYTTLVIHGRPRASKLKKHKAKAACLCSVGDSNGSKQRDTIDKTIKPFIAFCRQFGYGTLVKYNNINNNTTLFIRPAFSSLLFQQNWQMQLAHHNTIISQRINYIQANSKLLEQQPQCQI
ncbi:hypothetical protein T12_9776 [Trichinella patagoniensis]|uniref:Uncharacterized protein n=1 Tax=Trichinella patagoniensis TaxID=990121 RepID=A0A0V1A4U6_9BILA|nr:hypothetical protein T12_9776 [Trichinella patagoniensis]